MKKEIDTDKATVKKIIETAVMLFAQKGYSAVSVKELANAAGVNIALISYYFGGKENLYKVALESQLAIKHNIISTIKAKNLSPTDKIRHYARAVAKMNSENPYVGLVYGEILNPTACFDTVVRPNIISIHRFVRDCICDAIAKGEFRSDLEPDCIALSLASLIHFYFYNKQIISDLDLLPDREDQAEDYVCGAVEAYLRGIANTSCFSQEGEEKTCI